jgi:hypothetical protein
MVWEIRFKTLESLVYQIFMQKLVLSLGFTGFARCSCLLVFCVSAVGESHMDTTSYLQLTFFFPSLCFIIMSS